MNSVMQSVGNLWRTQVTGDGTEKNDFENKAKGAVGAGAIGAGAGGAVGFFGGVISETESKKVTVPNPDYVGPNNVKLFPVEGESGGISGPDAYIEVNGSNGAVKLLPQGQLDWMKPGVNAPRVTELGQYSERSTRFEGGYGHFIARPDGTSEYVPSEAIAKTRIPTKEVMESDIRSWSNVGIATLIGAGIGFTLGVAIKVLNNIKKQN